MLIYKIIKTTDNKYKGKLFIFYRESKSIDILDVDENRVCQSFEKFKIKRNHIRLVNSNYSIKGKLV